MGGEHLNEQFENLGLEQEYQAKIIHLYEDLLETLVRHGKYKINESSDKRPVNMEIIGVTMTNPETGEVEFHDDLSLLLSATPKDHNGYKKCSIEMVEKPKEDTADEATVGEVWFDYHPTSGKIKTFQDMPPEADMLDWKDILENSNREMDRRLHNIRKK